MKRLRILGAALALALGVLGARPAQAARTLPFHSSSWLTWIQPNASFVHLYGGNLDGLSIFAYAFDNNGNLVPEDPNFVDPALVTYHGQTQGGLRPTFVTIVNDRVTGLARHAGDIRFDGALIDQILRDPAKRAQLIAQIAAQAPKADGIDIDFESLLATTYPYYPIFIQELRAAIGPTKLLVVDAQPKTTTTVGARGNAINWQAILPYIDQLRVLTYYYSYGGSTPGPVVSQAQVDALIQFALVNQNVPISKLHFVFSVFGWDWPAGSIGSIVEYDEALRLAQAHGVTPFRDPASNNIRVNYTDNGVAHQIWIDDSVSLIPKIMQVLNAGIRHVDFWQLGSGDPALWQWISNNTTNIPDPTSNRQPVIYQLTPSSARPGGPGFTLTLLGDNFESGAQISWNGQLRPTTFFNATKITASIPASDIASAGTASVTVFNPVNQLGSNAITFYIAGAPTITTLTPSNARVNSPAFTLTLDGSGYSVDSIVRWSQTDLVTTFISATQLQAQVPVNLLVNRGIVPISVANPVAQGGLSVSKSFSVRLVPNINSLTPGVASAGGPGFTMTLSGSGFASDSVVQWNGSNRPTVFVDTSTLRVSISGSDIASPGRIPVVVVNPAPGGTSAPRTFIINPAGAQVPTIIGLNPSSARVNDPAFTLTLLGSNFINGAVVEWEGVARTTTWVSATKILAAIPASDLTIAGRYSVTVTNPGPTGGTSAAALFTVDGTTAPIITGVTPSTATAGGQAFTLFVDGTDFDPAARIRWNGAIRATTMVSPTRLQTTIFASDIAAAGYAQIIVANPGRSSTPWTFPVIGVPPAPAITNLVPAVGAAGGPGFTLTVRGRNFTAGSVIQWNGSARSTVFVSTITLQAAISAADRAVAGLYPVNVVDNGQTSNTLNFTVTGSTVGPTIFSISPSTATAGGPAFRLIVRGQLFTAQSIVNWNGSARTTTFGSTTTLTAAITAADIAAAGTANVTVVTSTQTSNGMTFTILASTSTPPAPGITNLSPAVGIAGGPGFTLTVRGSRLTASSVIQWNGSARVTTFVSTTTLQAAISAADRAVAGLYPVTVVDHGLTSNSLNFTVTGSTISGPAIFTLVPSTAIAGGPAFSLIVRGRLFTPQAIVTWNGAARTTTFVSTTTVRAAITAADIAAPATIPVSVTIGTTTTNALNFQVLPSTTTGNPTSVPVLDTITPSTVTAGGADFNLILTGSGFDATSVVRWNSSFLQTTLVSGTQLQALVPATDISSPGMAVVVVFNPGVTGGTSRALSVTIVTPAAAAISDLGQSRVFPNPWVSELHGGAPITFDRLTAGSTIKIFTLSARWVRTLEAPSGSATWDLRTDSGDRAASGYYIYLITDRQGHRARGKLAIVK